MPSSQDDKKDTTGTPPPTPRSRSRSQRSRSPTPPGQSTAPTPTGQGGVLQNVVENPPTSSPASTAVNANRNSSPAATSGSPLSGNPLGFNRTDNTISPSRAAMLTAWPIQNSPQNAGTSAATPSPGAIFECTAGGKPCKGARPKKDLNTPGSYNKAQARTTNTPEKNETTNSVEELEKAEKGKEREILYLKFEPTNPSEQVDKNEPVRIYRKAARMSSLLKTMLDFTKSGGAGPMRPREGILLKGEPHGQGKEAGTILPLSNSSCLPEILELIAKYCQHHMDDVAWSAHTRYDEFEMDEYDLEDERLKEPLTYWDWDFFNRLAMVTGDKPSWEPVGRAKFYNLMIAAYYMGIDGLVEVGGKFLCNLMKGKTQGEINTLLNIPQAQAQVPEVPENPARAQP